MDLKKSNFQYNALLSKNDVSFAALDLFPSLSEITFSSRIFKNYAECVKSCKFLLEDISKQINEGHVPPIYKVSAETNPMQTNIATVTQDWGNQEVVRFWVYDKTQEGGNITAIAKAGVFAIAKDDEGFVVQN